MKAELIKRLFRTMATGDWQGLTQLGRVIIDDERRRGHEQLAKQLEEWWSKMAAMRGNVAEQRSPIPHPSLSLSELPTSRRFNTPLVNIVETDQLEHHMVLAANVEEKFSRIEREYAARERLAKFGLAPRRKILLYGPPGCGKTLGAQRLAWNLGLPLLKVRFDALVSSFLGETAANLRSVFEAAERQPCLLFLDECDSLATSRLESNDVGEMKRIVNALLVLLDDYRAPGLLVAATNLTEQLDRAFWRRFDDVFEVPKPGEEELHRLIKTTLSSMRVESLDWTEIIGRLEGSSASAAVRVARDAAKHAVLDGDGTVTQHHFVLTLDEIRGD